MMPSKFRKKPVVVEAMHWMGPPRHSEQIPGGPADAPSVDDLERWGARVEPDGDWGLTWTLRIYVAPEDDWIRCPVGFWIIKGIKGEFYPCDPEIFEQTYEAVPA